MIAHEIRLAGDTSRLIGWLDMDKDSRHLAAIEIPFLQGPMEVYWEDEDAGEEMTRAEVEHNNKTAEGRRINWHRLGIGSPHEFDVLRLPFVTIGPNRCLIVDPENLPILQQVGGFRPHG